MEAEVDLSGRDPVVLVPAQPGPGEVDTPYSLPLSVAAETISITIVPTPRQAALRH